MRTAPKKQISFLEDVREGDSTFEQMRAALNFSAGPMWPDRFGAALQKRALRPIRTLSLFSGGGGLDVGFHDAGFHVLTMLEIEERFVATLEANCGKGKYFGDTEIRCEDIRNYRPAKGARVDFIIGGPPCQSFSAAGRRAAGVPGTKDERGVLFEEYVRILKAVSPRGFLFENVYGLTGAENGSALEKIRKAFAEAGYKISYRILDAADYGVPQHRERLFIVGVKRGEFLFPRPTHGPDSPGRQPHVGAADAIGGVPESDKERAFRLGGRFGRLLDAIPPGLNYSFYTEKMGHPNPVFAWRSKFSDFLYKADPETPTRTLKAQGGQYTGPFHWKSRPFSVAELKRLQTIPDDYEIVGSKQVAVHQIGNSVPPQLARILALAISDQVFSVFPPFEVPRLEPTKVLGFRKRKRLLTAVYQEKARAAIASLRRGRGGPGPGSRSYAASLSGNDFSWSFAPKIGGNLWVEFQQDDELWRIFVSNDGKKAAEQFAITIVPPPSSAWGLKAKSVILAGSELAPGVFTGAWKAFEAELIRGQIKADLVQLCGYYQYKPAFRGSMSVNGDPNDEWGAVRAIVSGRGVRAILPLSELSEFWGLPRERAVECLSFLRTLGYEVRNKNTNPQIPKDHYLIPYAFPTLTPLSVQLRKSLEPAYA